MSDVVRRAVSTRSLIGSGPTALSRVVAVMLAFALVGSFVNVATPAGAAAPTSWPLPVMDEPLPPDDWSIVTSPNASSGQTTNFLSGTTCVSGSDCWAVGYYLTGHIRQTLIQHWDGASWQIVSSPNVTTTEDNVLLEVACASATDCWAVGSSISAEVQRTLILRWDGTSWSIVASPNSVAADANHLNDVACTSATDCWAVGHSRTGGTHRSLMMRWDGIAWSVALSPEVDPTAPQDNQLNGLSCPSASTCWAVGQTRTGNGSATIAMRWDGRRWSIVASPEADTPANFFTDVSCASDSDCWSVGYARIGSSYQTLTEHWDGTSWTLVPSPNVSTTQSHFLRGVSCASVADCWAVGTSANSSRTLALHWDGSAWTIVTSPDAPPQSTGFYDVSCISPLECATVGHVRSGTLYQSFAARWDGASWAVVPSHNVGPTRPNFLNSITCRSDCWAVGHSYTAHDGSVAQTLVQRWDGDSWTIVASPNAGTQHNFVHDIACTSSSNCWAVGSYLSDGIFRTLVVQWDGTSWQLAPSPNAVSGSNRLHAVSCVSASDCWAVGYAQTGDGYRTMIQRWDGTSWSIVFSPNTTSTIDNLLLGVTCVSSSDCWATGYDYTGSAYETLIQHWDGSSWEIVPSPNTSSIEPNFLRDVECTSSSDCWAIGHHVVVDTQQSLILRWDGTSWALAEAPNTSGAEHNFLEDVTCASPALCWTVGRYFSGGAEKTLIARWDGSSWAVVASPNGSGSLDNILYGASCSAATGCWAVGFFHGPSEQRTLILRNEDVVVDPDPQEPEETDISFTSSSASSGQFSDDALFEAQLTTADGSPRAGEEVIFELSGTGSSRTFTTTTDADGVASVVARLSEKPGPHQLTATFAGTDSYRSSSEATSFLVEREDTTLDLTVRGRGNDQALEARLSDEDTPSAGLGGATVEFYADGEPIGSSTTAGDGVATLGIPPRYRGGKRRFEARFSGDDFYAPSGGQA